MSLRKIVSIIIVVLSFLASTTFGETYYVDPNGVDDPNGGDPNNPFATISYAIDIAIEGDVVIVGIGTYLEYLAFDGNNITLTSTDPDDWDVVEATIIDTSDEWVNCVEFVNGEDANSVLKGFTIRANSIYFGIRCNSSSPTIGNCIIEGGMYGVYCNSASPAISNCIVRDNSMFGIYCGPDSCPDISSCIVENNSYRGIDCSSTSSPVIHNSTVVNNYGGVYCLSGSSATVTNCILWGNGDDLSGCSATYSCIEDGDSGTGNISSYPYFEDYANDDFHLTWNSPCINRGDPNGSYTGQIDIDGDNRVADEEFVDARVDMGADEFNTHNINLVMNPNFEDGNDANGFPLYWNSAAVATDMSLDSNESHSGNYSVKAYCDDDVNANWSILYSDSIGAEFGSTYKLSVWSKCEPNVDRTDVSMYQFDTDSNYLDQYTFKYYTHGLASWTPYGGLRAADNADVNDVQIHLAGPTKCKGTVWWDDVSLTEQVDFLPAYGCVNEPSVAKSLDLGVANDDDPNYNGGIVWNISSMDDPCTDPCDENITYRTTKAGKTMVIEFPAFNVDPNDANGLPLTPMLLEVMYKDTTSRTDFTVMSKIGYINLDPNYGITDPNDRDKNLAHLGDCNDNRWKYIQYAFQKSDFQLLRAIDGNFTIKIHSPYYTSGIPIDYISLRKITEAEYKALTDKQRAMRGFYEVNLPADVPSPDVNYADPNLTVFVRDIMKPVYLHTKPGPNEPNSISVFSAWGEVEPMSFSIYSENGVNNLTVAVSDLAHSTDGNSIISNANISIYEVVYDEKRLIENSDVYSYALLPDRLEEFTSLSVDPNTSERIWLKVKVPAEDANLSAGLYEGTVTIERDSEPNKTIDIDFTVYDITLDGPNNVNPVWMDVALSNDRDVVFNAVGETGFDPFGASLIRQIGIGKDPCDTNDPIDPNSLVFDTNDFEESLDKAVEAGFAKDTIFVRLWRYYWDDIYNFVMNPNYNESDPNLWNNLSEPNFVKGVGLLIDKYTEIGDSCDPNITFVYFIMDEPGINKPKRIITDRISTIIHDVNKLTATTYHIQCDDPLSPGKYNVPDGNIPPLTDLVDYKIWSLSTSHEDTGYKRHYDPCDPYYYDSNGGYFGYYTTHFSQICNPVYNRFLHGLFAFGTNAKAVLSYKMGIGVNNPYNDFDSGASQILPESAPDFLFTYPTWSGELLYTIGGLEGIREGIKDAKYIATLEALIEGDPNNAVAQAAQDYLDEVKSRIDPSYKAGYYDQSTELGFYEKILQYISDTSDPNDFEAFTEVRKKVAEFIGLLIDGNSYSVWNKTQNKFYTTIQGGINDANNGDELIVARDTHYESIDFNGKNITLRSFDPNNWDVVEATIIDANSGSGDAVTFASGEDANTALRGLTVTGALVGVHVDSVGPVISRCILQGNQTGVKYTKKSTGTLIVNNKIHDSNGYGVFGHKGSANIKNNWIYDSDKGIKLSAGASADIYNNTIVNNISYGIDKGGSGGQVTISNCIIWDCNNDLYGCSATYSCISDCNDAAGTGNICGDANDPLFVAPDSNDFHIDLDSPCIDVGDPNDPNGYTGQYDIDGDDRVIDIYGKGDGVVDVDMGGDEYKPLE